MKDSTTLTGARQEVWEDYFSLTALLFTIKNLKEIRDMAIISAQHPDELVWDPHEFQTYSSMLSYLEDLLTLHLCDQSEVARNLLPPKTRGFVDRL